MSTLYPGASDFLSLSISGVAQSAISLATANTWTLTNVGGSAARTFSGNQATAATVSATLSRLIEDLKYRGLI